ncbi:hypothetical protein EG856_02205 [Mycoplasmopsis phocirhinis]|uniref:Transmembrane protein n=1 Tax=Mycoplasmopsis phocirhinis TaxID=142650 RepID=A0A4P6MPA3_9BACT|nr:hypothetical protein [Mycoplasmopsis phocirhinis]QBF34720.1 hypothetical protein EG856_02205 [Mycoplasmopsis phocirhinis]
MNSNLLNKQLHNLSIIIFMNNYSSITKNPRPSFIKKIEKKSKNQIIRDRKSNAFPEFLKLTIFLFFTTFIVLVQYSSNIFGIGKTATIFKKIYLYSIGLAFGDLTIFIVLGIFISLILNWLESLFNRYYFIWVKPYRRVDYWIIRRRIKMFIWLNLTVFILSYHWYLLSQRNISNINYYSFSDLKTIFVEGWYKSFTQGNTQSILNYPNTNGNIGIFIDSIFNILHVIVISPWLVFTLILAIHCLSWIYLLTLKPREYFKNFAGNKSLEQVIVYLKNKKINTVYYFTNEVSRYFDFINLSAKVLEINTETNSMTKIIKQINKKQNRETLSNNPLTSEYFLKTKSTNENNNEFISSIDKEKLNQIELNSINIQENKTSNSTIDNAKNNIEFNSYYQNKNIEPAEFNNGQNLTKNNDVALNNQSQLIDTINLTSEIKTKSEIIQIHNTQLIEINYDNEINNEIKLKNNPNNVIDQTIELRRVQTQELYQDELKNININLKKQGNSQTIQLEMNNNIQNHHSTDDITQLGFDLSDLEQKTEHNSSDKIDNFDKNAPEIKPFISKKNNNNISLGFDEIMTTELKMQNQTKTQNKNSNSDSFTFMTTVFDTEKSKSKNNLNDTQTIEEDNGDWISPFMEESKN